MEKRASRRRDRGRHDRGSDRGPGGPVPGGPVLLLRPWDLARRAVASALDSAARTGAIAPRCGAWSNWLRCPLLRSPNISPRAKQSSMPLISPGFQSQPSQAWITSFHPSGARGSVPTVGAISSPPSLPGTRSPVNRQWRSTAGGGGSWRGNSSGWATMGAGEGEALVLVLTLTLCAQSKAFPWALGKVLGKGSGNGSPNPSPPQFSLSTWLSCR